VHPNYIGTIVVDRSAFDLHNCPELKAAPIIAEQPKRVTIFETPELQLVGLTIPNFWRKNIVPVRVGDRVEAGRTAAAIVGPHPGSRRGSAGALSAGRLLARPAAAAQKLNWSAYGTSFLIGRSNRISVPSSPSRRRVRPGHQDVSPELHARRQCEPARRCARYRAPGARCDSRSPVGGDLPFAALRSMFVTEINNDVAHLGWRAKGAPSWERAPIMDSSAPARWKSGPVASCRRATTPVRRTCDARFRALASFELLAQLLPRTTNGSNVNRTVSFPGAPARRGRSRWRAATPLNAVDRDAPPGVPHIIEQQHAAAGASTATTISVLE